MTDSKADFNPFGKLNYLVVDDFENFRLSMRQMLRSCGADQIELVANANQAIQYCAYNHIDVVLCDFNLGDGKSGQHVLEELRHKKLLKRSSLFLMVTAETSKEMVMGAREYQPDAYLTKPVAREMYVDLVQSLLRRESLPKTADRYLSNLSRRAALLKTESRSVLRNESAYAALEEELSRMAPRVDDHRLDDPFLRHASTDGGADDELVPFDPTP